MSKTNRSIIIILLLIITIIVNAQEYTMPINKLKRYLDDFDSYYHNDSLPNGVYIYFHEKDTNIVMYKCYVYKGIFYDINDTSFIHKKKTIIYWTNGNKRYEFYVNEKKWVHGPFIYYRQDGSVAARGTYWKDSLWTFLKDTTILTNVYESPPFALMDLELRNNKAGRWIYMDLLPMISTSESWYFSTEKKRYEYIDGGTRKWYYDNGKVRLKIITIIDGKRYKYLFYNRNGEMIRREESDVQNKILFEGY